MVCLEGKVLSNQQSDLDYPNWASSPNLTAPKKFTHCFIELGKCHYGVASRWGGSYITMCLGYAARHTPFSDIGSSTFCSALLTATVTKKGMTLSTGEKKREQISSNVSA